jgi:hypothetical protein
MPSSPQQRVDDEALKGYLFGDLPADETERLDELSIIDDDFAARLSAVETDLVDAYVRHELSGDALEKFQTRYLSSPARRQRVAFAEGFSSFADRYRPERAQAKSTASSWRNWFTFPRLALAGGLAMAMAVGVVVVDHLQHHENPAANRASLQPAPTLQAPAKPTNQGPPATSATAKDLASRLSALPISVTTFVLAPQMRGGTQLPRLVLPHGTIRVDFHLELETDDFPRYRLTLKSLKTNKPLWQSGSLAAVTKNKNRTLSMSLPANLLKQEMYQLDLTGKPSSGEPELVSSYVFRIVTQ